MNFNAFLSCSLFLSFCLSISGAGGSSGALYVRSMMPGAGEGSSFVSLVLCAIFFPLYGAELFPAPICGTAHLFGVGVYVLDELLRLAAFLCTVVPFFFGPFFFPPDLFGRDSAAFTFRGAFDFFPVALGEAFRFLFFRSSS